jgi:hypothetical protein
MKKTNGWWGKVVNFGFVAFCLTGYSNAALAQSGGFEKTIADIQVERKEHLNKMPTSEMAGKKFFIAVKDSPKGSELVRKRFKGVGFAVVDSAEEADFVANINGVVLIDGIRREKQSARLGEVMEYASDQKMAAGNDLRSQSVDAAQLLAERLFQGAFSVTDIVTWISQKTGVAGAVNRAITGDARGICLHPDCDKYVSQVIVSVNINNGAAHWWLEERAKDKDVVIDLLIQDALARALQPILELR